MPQTSLHDRLAREREGSALFSSVILITVISTLTFSFLSMTVNGTKRTELEVDEYAVNVGAESVTALAVNRIWGRFQNQRAGQATNRDDFRAYLDGLGITDQSASATPTGVDVSGLCNLPTDGAGRDELAGVNVENLEVLRTDEDEAIRLIFTATVSNRTFDETSNDWRNLRQTIQETYLIEPEEWQGLDYALLANNINCIMCHAEIDSADRKFNQEPGNFGTYDRVKVGSIESLQLRTNPDSWIAGTLYVGGTAFDQGGNPISNWSEQALKSREFDGDGLLVQDHWGDLTKEDLHPADQRDPDPLENLYLAYGQDPDKMVDGLFPTDFPPVFPDNGGVSPNVPSSDRGNRIIDDSEFNATVAGVAGSISGGKISVVSGADTIDSISELDGLSTAPNQTSLAPITNGSVVLIGTDANPIQLNGEVAIRGDLILFGKVQGEGSLLVSGNVYIPEDLSYVDGTDANGERTFGRDSGGSTNALAIASGGNILVGNIFHPRFGRGQVTGSEDGSFSFIMDELAIFNRAEWTKTQPVLPGRGEDFNQPGSWTVSNPLYEGPNYVPRYYSFNDGGTIPIYNKGIYFDASSSTWVGKEHPGNWDQRRLTYADADNAGDPILYNADGSPKAAVYPLTAGSWMSDAMLKLLMNQRASARSSRRSEAMQVDALLYSNNSIFGIIPNSLRNRGFDGKMTVNGGIVAADIGLLAPTKININYDDRPKDLLNIASETQIRMRKLLRAPFVP